MDTWGSEYGEDFAVVDMLSLIDCIAYIEADQNRWTGAEIWCNIHRQMWIGVS